VAEDLPVKGWYVPVGHERHCAEALDPWPVPYVPAAHAWHCDSEFDAAVGENLPAPHRVHALDAWDILYEPAAQSTQDAEVVCPVPDWYLPEAQKSHNDSWSAALLTPYFPVAQGVHVALELAPVESL